ncbi:MULTISPECIES: SDR family NAD(P)-dependent oxidoreductase [Sphingobium]|uniref:SDR family NAD(P)-dependent oxidoreductase n=1 Tax=Sphingobium TaxID=165695 RepID=UPI0015EC3DAB|nr:MULTISPECIES: SDR family NAD(P)-dependent oxidoreductase [Sphingobium]MCW2362417.1 NAD(P)-dependent dehydrogenase (short-subunit alcohol dehydrogenase family) [Sphingobium sp. B10D3B]MCW2400904.1 NAD(P)-dependent dehydrogenase (short-subunit alcohol dehydrogenase family) [Sphingobium sp. B10D7B]MCW2407883.1 NAD(P)-dependent dehydrogenase (short-subunit alcohol dehydrogenase family) [Sphingobium xanthum]
MTDTTDNRPLAGRLALVTGASRGIGAATAIELARDGAHVVLVARSVPDLEGVEEQIHAAGGSATIAPLDLTDGESIGRLATAISGRWEALDVLVLNAATLGTLAAVTAIDTKEFARQLTLNIASTQALIAAFDPMLRKSSDARVVALSSGVATAPRAYWGAYGASKAAQDVLVSAYGQEVTKISKVRTHIVNPGPTRTTMRARAYPGEDPATLKTPDVVGRAIADLVVSDAADGTRVDLPR